MLDLDDDALALIRAARGGDDPSAEERARALGTITPSMRSRFWWWSRVADLDPLALEQLPSVAALVARFPSARRELEALTAVQQRLDDDVGAPGTSSAPSPFDALFTRALARKERTRTSE